MCARCLTVLGPITIFSNQPTHRCIDGASSGSIYQTYLLHVIATRMHMMRPAGDSRHMHVIYYTCIWHAYCNMTCLLHSNYFILFPPLFFFFYFLLHISIFFFFDTKSRGASIETFYKFLTEIVHVQGRRPKRWPCVPTGRTCVEN